MGYLKQKWCWLFEGVWRGAPHLPWLGWLTPPRCWWLGELGDGEDNGLYTFTTRITPKSVNGLNCSLFQSEQWYNGPQSRQRSDKYTKFAALQANAQIDANRRFQGTIVELCASNRIFTQSVVCQKQPTLVTCIHDCDPSALVWMFNHGLNRLRSLSCSVFPCSIELYRGIDFFKI